MTARLLYMFVSHVAGRVNLVNLFSVDYRHWMIKQKPLADSGSSGAASPEAKIPPDASHWESSSFASYQAPTALITERMRKRRAFADRDLEAVMFQREQIALAQWQRISSCFVPRVPSDPKEAHLFSAWSQLPHPVVFQPMFQQSYADPSQTSPVTCTPSLKSPDLSKHESISLIDTKVNSTDLVKQTKTTSTPSAAKSRISFSVESIIGIN